MERIVSFHILFAACFISIGAGLLKANLQSFRPFIKSMNSIVNMLI